MNRRIFLVDDDPFWTAMLTQMLNNLGYANITTFDSGEDCVNNLHLNPCLVFLDFQMEGMNGLETLEKIKNYYPGISVIFCTAHEDLSVAVDAMKQGSRDYLLKSNATLRDVKKITQSLSEIPMFAHKIY